MSKEKESPSTLHNQPWKRAMNVSKLNSCTPHDWEDLYQNTKQWEESSTGWVDTMTKSKENKEKYQEYLETTENPMIYRDWLKQNTVEQ